MDAPTTDTYLDPDYTRKIAAILSIQPDDSAPLTQFSGEQLAAYRWAVRWLHDFNLDRRPKPNFSDEVLGRLSDFHEAQMNANFRGKEPMAAPVPAPANDRREETSPDDPLAEWTQRVLVGMKRMTEDPEYRASIEKRLS